MCSRPPKPLSSPSTEDLHRREKSAASSPTLLLFLLSCYLSPFLSSLVGFSPISVWRSVYTNSNSMRLS